MNNSSQNTSLPPWHVVETAIQKEKKWLTEVFDFGPYDDKDSGPSPLPQDEMLRQLSIAIVRGDLKVKELRSEKVNGLWTDDEEQWNLEDTNERHGGDWHRQMMHLIKKYFIAEGFEVINEPNLHHGRADLGVYKDGHKNLFVEIGTTSLFKTWINLRSMPESIFLFVPTAHYALEFKVTASDATLSSLVGRTDK